jgi:hypothetical protein
VNALELTRAIGGAYGFDPNRTNLPLQLSIGDKTYTVNGVQPYDDRVILTVEEVNAF